VKCTACRKIDKDKKESIPVGFVQRANCRKIFIQGTGLETFSKLYLIYSACLYALWSVLPKIYVLWDAAREISLNVPCHEI
jgi:hypothetical protein